MPIVVLKSLRIAQDFSTGKLPLLYQAGGPRRYDRTTSLDLDLFLGPGAPAPLLNRFPSQTQSSPVPTPGCFLPLLSMLSVLQMAPRVPCPSGSPGRPAASHVAWA